MIVRYPDRHAFEHLLSLQNECASACIMADGFVREGADLEIFRLSARGQSALRLQHHIYLHDLINGHSGCAVYPNRKSEIFMSSFALFLAPCATCHFACTPYNYTIITINMSTTKLLLRP